MPRQPTAPRRLASVLELLKAPAADPPRLQAGAPVSYYGQYRTRGRWLTDPYTGLRNAAWAVRNSRVGAGFNPLALRLVLAEAERLITAGEPLADVLEAFAELLTRP